MELVLLLVVIAVLITSSKSLVIPKILSPTNVNKLISTLSISLSILAPSTILVPQPLLAADVKLTDKLKELQDIQAVLDAADQKYEELPSGVSYREYRSGKGNKVVQKGSTVIVEMTVRCKSFPTGNEPGGVRYYSTKEDTPYNALEWTIGSGTLLPGLEEGMIGMKRNALRRIEVPSRQVFKARSEGQLPLPAEKDADGNRRFKNLFKTDATLLFEVLVSKIIDPVTAPSEVLGINEPTLQ
jgi:hypothetical protein